jgi:hypothetical protein
MFAGSIRPGSGIDFHRAKASVRLDLDKIGWSVSSLVLRVVQMAKTSKLYRVRSLVRAPTTDFVVQSLLAGIPSSCLPTASH